MSHTHTHTQTQTQTHKHTHTHTHTYTHTYTHTHTQKTIVPKLNTKMTIMPILPMLTIYEKIVRIVDLHVLTEFSLNDFL